MNVILLGYMGSGKTVVGVSLANKLSCKFIDLDDYIETEYNLEVKDIFKTKGEIFFRKLETKYLKKIIDSNKNIVISLGGGTPCYGTNMESINNSDNVHSIYLKASIKTLVERLMLAKDTRPLISHLKSESELGEFIGKHLFERSRYYQMANSIIDVNQKSIRDIEEEILLTLF